MIVLQLWKLLRLRIHALLLLVRSTVPIVIAESKCVHILNNCACIMLKGCNMLQQVKYHAWGSLLIAAPICIECHDWGSLVNFHTTKRTEACIQAVAFKQTAACTYVNIVDSSILVSFFVTAQLFIYLL